MVMSVVEAKANVGQNFADQNQAGLYPELEGARVLITGLEAGHGVDIARAFADAGCRLILQTGALDTELEIVLEVLAQSAQDIRVSSAPIADQDAALHFAQDAVRAYGGIDAVVNLARLDDRGLEPDAGVAEIEDRVVATLGPAFRITHVIANRMQVTWKEGLILNIVSQGAPKTPAGATLGRIARAALAGLTRQEAERWAGQAVRINAIVPASDDNCEPGAMQPGAMQPGAMQPGLSSEPEIAALALHLAGRRGRTLSGLVFDAASVTA